MKRSLYLVLGLWLLATGPASATTMKRLLLSDLTSEADVIVQGRVVSRVSSWNEDRTRIYTVTELHVDESLKGPARPGEVLRIRQIGGQVDGLSQVISGNAELRTDEEVVLFLDRDETLPWHYVVGMAQGKFGVDRSGPSPVVRGDLSDLSVVVGGQPALAPVAGVAPVPHGVDAFKAEIRRHFAPAVRVPASAK